MLTKEEFEALPEKAQGAFVEDGEQYVPVKDAKLKQTLDDVDSKFKSAEQRTKELEEKLSSYEEAKKAEIEAARAEALEQARSKGDVKAIEERYQQQMADFEKRNGELIQGYEDKVTQLSSTLKSREKSLIASKLASEVATDSGRDLFGEVIASRIDVDLDTGKPIFLDADGRATSLDYDGFKKELEADARLKPLLRANVATQGGGMANGSGAGQGGASTVKGNLGGTRDERKAAIAKRFNLNN